MKLLTPFAIVALLLTGNAYGATAKDNAELNAQYQRDKEACISGQSHQDRATCLREAGAVYRDAKQGTLDSGMAEQQYQKNELARCKALPPQDQEDCRRRITNPTALDGSVNDGGILRKSVTTIPAPAN